MIKITYLINRISWATKGDSKDQYVRWGTSPGNYTFSKPANATTYTAKELCGSPANAFGWREPGIILVVAIL
jgi:hypothetical protein